MARQGKHTVMTDGQRILTIPRHNPVNALTLGGIARDAGLTPGSFWIFSEPSSREAEEHRPHRERCREPPVRLDAFERRRPREPPFRQAEGAAGAGGGPGVDAAVADQGDVAGREAEAAGEEGEARGVGLAARQAVAAQDLAEIGREAEPVEQQAGERFPLFDSRASG